MVKLNFIITLDITPCIVVISLDITAETNDGSAPARRSQGTNLPLADEAG